MGVTGLTTFMSKCGQKYKKKILVSQQVVVIDGNNLMFHIYASYDVRKYNHYLFGGDCGAFAQAVRLYFQKLKCCKIFPIVIFDGAYEAGKLKTRMKRFATSLKENVHQSTPGKSYTTCLMKDVFTEILIEQDIDHYQTEFEADDTIAFIAHRLSCPVLSSDSDFFIYTKITTIPFETISFKKNLQKTSKKSNVVKELPASSHVLEGKSVKLQELCEVEFRLADYRVLPLTAVVIGNDQIASSVFANFLPGKDNQTKSGVSKQLRIERLMKWFSKQPSYEKARDVLLESIKACDRDNLRSRVEDIVSNYMGAGGEEYVWNLVRSSKNLVCFLEQNIPDKIFLLGDRDSVLEVTTQDSGLSRSEDLTAALEDLNIEDDEESDVEEENCSQESDDDVDVEDTNEIAIPERPNVPEWFLDPLCRSHFPSPVCKILYNRTIYLTPQVEVASMPSSHAISVPIIQILGGVLYGPGNVTLVSRDKYNPVKIDLPTICSLNGTSLPCVTQSTNDFRQTLTHDKRLSIILQSLLIKADEESYVHEWPQFMKFWIATCIYYLRKLRKAKDLHIALSVAIAVILCCLKNFTFPPTVPPGSQNVQTQKVSLLLQQQVCDKNLEKLVRGYAIIPNYDLKKFWRSYDMVRVFFFSQYQSVVFHAHSLNRIFGDPLKAPKMGTMDCNMVYNICTTVAESFDGHVIRFIEKALNNDAPLKRVLLRFVDFVLPGAVIGPPEKELKKPRNNRKSRSTNAGEEGDPEKLNRYIMLAETVED